MIPVLSELKIHVGGSPADVRERVLAALRRSEAGEAVSERHLTFQTFEQLRATLTGGRLDVLRLLHRRPLGSVQAVADALGRDVGAVTEDLAALEAAGLIDRSDEHGFTADYDSIAIETRIAL